jgi:hypothetical protein
MNAKAWKGGMFGISVGKANANAFFDRSLLSAAVEIDGTYFHFTLPETFWTTCPEIRGAVIGRWLKARGLDVWPRGKPSSVELIPVAGRNRFKLQAKQQTPISNGRPT